MDTPPVEQKPVKALDAMVALGPHVERQLASELMPNIVELNDMRAMLGALEVLPRALLTLRRLVEKYALSEEAQGPVAPVKKILDPVIKSE